MDKSSIKKRILTEEDFINSPAFNNSLNSLIQKHQDGIDDNYAAKVLMISEEEIEDLYQEAVKSLRKDMDEEKN